MPVRERIREQLVERDVDAATHVRRQCMRLGEPGERRVHLSHPVGVGANGHPESVSHFALRSVAKLHPASFPCQLREGNCSRRLPGARLAALNASCALRGQNGAGHRFCFPTFVNFVCTVVNSPAANDDLDRALVRRFLDGERAAGDELVNRFHRSVFNVALRMLGNVQDAEDVTQTTFGNAFAALDSYDPKYRFFSWIYRMTVNESLNTMKRRRNVVSLDGSFDVPAAGESSESAAEAEVQGGKGAPGVEARRSRGGCPQTFCFVLLRGDFRRAGRTGQNGQVPALHSA